MAGKRLKHLKKYFFLAFLAQAFFAPLVFAQDSPSTSESELTSSSEIPNESSSENSNEDSDENASEKYASENGEKKSRRKNRAEKKSESAENISETPAEEKSEKTLITIMNALVSGNKKDEASGDDLLTFEGNVKISVEKGAVKTIISADKVSFNRAREMLFAEGAVRLEQTEKNGSTQTVTSDTLLFNTATLEGVFDNSRVVRADSNALNLPSGSKISVYSDIFARDDSGTIAFKNGKLTFCDDDENPHWTIRASRIWLLPGNEFAFLNGLIYVGAVPVDEEKRIRIDDWELRDDIQAEAEKAMAAVNDENLREYCDIEGYKHDFLVTNGFDVEGVDYEKDVARMDAIE